MVIDPQRVKRAVYNRIDFELPEETWKEINVLAGTRSSVLVMRLIRLR